MFKVQNLNDVLMLCVKHEFEGGSCLTKQDVKYELQVWDMNFFHPGIILNFIGLKSRLLLSLNVTMHYGLTGVPVPSQIYSVFLGFISGSIIL